MKTITKLFGVICFGLLIASCQAEREITGEHHSEVFEAFLSPVDAPQKETVKIVVKHYPVSAMTADELLRELTSKGPNPNPKGGTFIAQTIWDIRWSYRYKRSKNGCKAENIQTHLIVTYNLPKWINASDARPGLVKYWNQFSDNLIAHEMGHAQIGYDIKKEIQSLLESQNETRDSCAKLGRALSALGHDVINTSKADKAYDVRTQHGSKQGARFSTRDAKKVR